MNKINSHFAISNLGENREEEIISPVIVYNKYGIRISDFENESERCMQANIKTLPSKLRKNGFDYTLILRGERTCIYEQRVTKGISYYEVFLLKLKPEKKVLEKIIPAGERFPHNEAFGKWAWSFRSYYDALRKYDELEQAGGVRV